MDISAHFYDRPENQPRIPAGSLDDLKSYKGKNNPKAHS